MAGNYQSIHKRLGSTPTATQAPLSYTVVGGDTLQTIAQKVFNSGYDSSLWRQLAEYNNITDFDSIIVGQILLVPSI